MNITEFITRLKAYVETTTPRSEDLSPESLLEMLFNVYTEFNGFDNQIIQQDFNDLYTAMNGKTSEKWTRLSIQSVPSAATMKRRDLRKALRSVFDWHRK